MERIQAAIEKARTERQDQKARPAAQARPDDGPPGKIDFVEAWQAIPAVDIDERQMEARRIYTRPLGNMGSMFDVLRTRVMQQMAQNKWTRLAVTSPTTGCGKTTVTVNLAFGLARQPESRILLAEMDFRRPSMAGVLGLGGTDMKFNEVLSGKADFAQHARLLGHNLAVSCNGTDRLLEPGELLHSSVVPRVLNDLSQTYAPDIMLLDLPPLTASDDVLALARHVDAVLIVAAAGETTISQLDNCEKELAQQTNILGVVLNKCRYMEDRPGYQYY